MGRSQVGLIKEIRVKRSFRSNWRNNISTGRLSRVVYIYIIDRFIT